ncbi:MAG TPA: universal stress protein [Ignavibacteriales bacterium]|nr:universal stress protein [Ignavibacteriales bacterium]
MNPEIKRILVPIDFSEHSKNALRYAINFAKIFQSKLHLIYVLEPVIYPADFSMGQIAFPSMDVELDSRAKEELDKLAEREVGTQVPYETIVKTGKPFVEINESAAELNIDLIIIASHGESGVEQILFGSTAEKVVRKAPCPVLSLRNPLKGFKIK